MDWRRESWQGLGHRTFVDGGFAGTAGGRVSRSSGTTPISVGWTDCLWALWCGNRISVIH